ncbi:glycosyltransferase family 2 protein [Paracoccus sulfuroxidans]|uniref:Glycosyl transferase family 2 n=1 Tax=Paracoccus sulfuroxidans TaxID=384678 RepID=A0A562NQH2_9RHOB|nr:glycosyltransferase family 2 protein [Paracoccus sulfuroxidans]TWI34281.1 glycosyl transferase family 2 [Paracoccus sulfuroxidans]
MRRVSITSVKDEAPYLVEWIAYQKLLGFDEVIVTSNDSTDGTSEILDRLAEAGWCKAIHFQRADHKASPQIAALELVTQLPELAEPCLLFVSDIDEFLQINVGQGRLDCLLEAAPDFDLMFVRWRVFGSSGQHEHEDALSIQRFLQSSPTSYRGHVYRHGEEESLGKPDYTTDLSAEELFNRHQSQRWTRTYKTLFHYHPGDKLSVHFPRITREPIIKVDGGGRLNPNERYSHLTFYGEHTYEGSYDICQLNHYANRSVDEYLHKILRGDGVHAKDPRGLDHWKVAECNEVAQEGMAKWEEPLAEIVARIIADCNLQALLDEAIIARRQKLQAALAADPELSTLRQQLVTMAGARFASSVAAA